MHAVVVSVTINDRDGALANLNEQIVPQVSGAPGFVAGYWIDVGAGRGSSFAVFESEDHARSAAEMVGTRAGDAVTVDSVAVGAVVAHA